MHIWHSLPSQYLNPFLNERPKLSPSLETKIAKISFFPFSLGGHVPMTKALLVTVTNPRLRKEAVSEAETKRILPDTSGSRNRKSS